MQIHQSEKLLKLLLAREAVLWDFDGVILDSMSIRDDAFRNTLNEYPQESVESLVQWHQKNGGLSRYVKFRQFQTDILNIPLDEDLVQSWAQIFSEYCMIHLGDSCRLISTTLSMIKSLSGNVPMHIVSGSDGDELRKLCNALDLTHHFITIQGSPTPKTELIKDVLNSFAYDGTKCVLVGDSVNDYKAATENQVSFIGFNNESLMSTGIGYWSKSKMDEI